MIIISDIDYLEPVAETSAMRLNGGFNAKGGFNALAIANFFAFASSPSTATDAVVETKTFSSPKSSYATSSINLIAAAPGPNGLTSASATTSASISPTIKTI
jgi:hypothetical protein